MNVPAFTVTDTDLAMQSEYTPPGAMRSRSSEWITRHSEIGSDFSHHAVSLAASPDAGSFAELGTIHGVMTCRSPIIHPGANV